MLIIFGEGPLGGYVDKGIHVSSVCMVQYMALIKERTPGFILWWCAFHHILNIGTSITTAGECILDFPNLLTLRDEPQLIVN